MVIGRYEIVQKLGEGGMGVVFLAKDPTLGRSVAIKIISKRATGESERIQSRFLQEAKLVALLNHPAIVSIFDLGEHAGQPYIVMEYVAGLSLYHLIRQRRLTSREILSCVRSVASALDYAHSQQVIHRDIKPANLLIGNSGVKVTDFGVAKLLTTSEDTNTSIVGTLAYMAPEQFKRTVQPRSDQYALAAVTYELLVGRTVFQAESEAEMVFKICNEPVSPANLVCAEINDPVSKVLSRGLSKDPADRFSTCVDFARSLELSLKENHSFQAAPSAPTVQDRPPASPIQISAPSFKMESPSGSGKILLASIIGSIFLGIGVYLLPHRQDSPRIFPPQDSAFQPVISNNVEPPQVSQPIAGKPQNLAKVGFLDPAKTASRKTLTASHGAPQSELTNKQRVAADRNALQPTTVIAREKMTGQRQSEDESAQLAPNTPANTQTANTPSDGRLVWTGTLDPGQEIDLDTSTGAGVVSGSLPGVPVSVEVHPSSIRIVTAPGPDNHWRKITVQNDNTKRSIVVVRWSLLRR